MSRPASRYPTDHELEILKIVWRNHKVTVRQVRDKLSVRRVRAYTSVMTVMTIMAQKGYLRRLKKNGTNSYVARVSRDAVTTKIVRDVADKLFDGSTSAMSKYVAAMGRKGSRKAASR